MTPLRPFRRPRLRRCLRRFGRDKRRLFSHLLLAGRDRPRTRTRPQPSVPTPRSPLDFLWSRAATRLFWLVIVGMALYVLGCQTALRTHPTP